jgi:hypothetical protein
MKRIKRYIWFVRNFKKFHSDFCHVGESHQMYYYGPFAFGIWWVDKNMPEDLR